MAVDVTLLGLGAALLAVGVGWRVWAIRRRRGDFRRRARTALLHPDRATRRAAVAAVTHQGLSPVADLLLETIGTEEDAGVLDAIAGAVARNQWEPSHRAEIFELRVWAQRRLAERAPKQPTEVRMPGQGQNGALSEAATRLDELLEANGHDGSAVPPATRGRALAVVTPDGERRLGVVPPPISGQRRRAEQRR